MGRLYSIALILWLSVSFSNCCHMIVQLEAEHGASNGTQMYRGSASNGLTISLNSGQRIEHVFRASSSCGVTVQNVAYSNDGISDYIALSRDGIALGSFHTVAATGGGELWNTFKNSGPVGNPYEISSGTHTLTLKVVSAVQYGHGVEIDWTTLSVVCAGIETGPEEGCPNSVEEVINTDETEGLTALLGETLGGSCGVMVLISVPACILAIKRLCKD